MAGALVRVSRVKRKSKKLIKSDRYTIPNQTATSDIHVTAHTHPFMTTICLNKYLKKIDNMQEKHQKSYFK